MNKLQDWSRNHPFKVITFLAIAVIIGIVAANGDVNIFPAALALIVLYGVWAWVFAHDSKRLLALVVAASLVVAPQQAHAAPFVLGGVVLIVACGLGYAGCRAVKCAKKIPKERGTNLIEEFHAAGEDCEYGAAFFWGEECYAERPFSTNREPVVMTLTIFVESETNCQSSLSFDVGSQSVIDLNELKEELAQHGLFVPEGPRISESYSRNRHPVAAEQVPIKFNHQTRTVSIGDGGVALTVESSADLTHWQPLVNLNAAVGTIVDIPDVSQGRQFFRVTTGGPTP